MHLSATISHHMVYRVAYMKHRTNIYLRPDQMKQLKALNEKTGAPVAELVRRAVDAYLAARAKEK
jgi:predicted DNA-binding protein